MDPSHVTIAQVLVPANPVPIPAWPHERVHIVAAPHDPEIDDGPSGSVTQTGILAPLSTGPMTLADMATALDCKRKTFSVRLALVKRRQVLRRSGRCGGRA